MYSDVCHEIHKSKIINLKLISGMSNFPITHVLTTNANKVEFCHHSRGTYLDDTSFTWPENRIILILHKIINIIKNVSLTSRSTSVETSGLLTVAATWIRVRFIWMMIVIIMDDARDVVVVLLRSCSNNIYNIIIIIIIIIINIVVIVIITIFISINMTIIIIIVIIIFIIIIIIFIIIIIIVIIITIIIIVSFIIIIVFIIPIIIIITIITI